ncbi:MAG: CotH kinase family protein [Chitinophagales bacterium]
MKNLFSIVIVTILINFTLLNAQSFYQEDIIQEIEITFAENNWDALLDAEKAGNGDYIMAQSVTINGEVFDSVGVKYKGNSTYNANQAKNPLHIELNTYKKHDYDDYTDIKLSNVAKDPSFLREVLSYQVLRQYMDAPLSNFANVYVNGTLIGLYSNSESISKRFVDDRFGSKSNTFVKCNPPAGAGPGTTDLPNLEYLGTDSAQYYDAYDLKSDNGWKELIDLCDTLDNDPNDIETILDVDRALWMLAFDNALVNLDSYIGGFAQNYYLYKDEYGRFLPVVWDLNESFGTFSMTGSGNLNSTNQKQEMSHLLHENDNDYPLISQLLSVPTYKKMYLAHYKTILQDNFTNNGTYYTAGLALQSTIDAAVQADNNKFYTYNNFVDNLTTDVTGGGGPGPGGQTTPGITNLMNTRASYLLGLSDFTNTEPTISDIIVSDDTPFLGDDITFTANVVNEDVVYFRYRFTRRAPFEKVQMFDDGMHNDGAANDDIYGVEVAISTSLMEYYIYAENSDIGKFSPTNAEHEFYSLASTSNVIGDVVINEFLSSNDLTVFDQDLEYDDWIEIYNKGTVAVDISGYTITDNPGNFTKFSFPLGTVINPDEYITIWADKDEEQIGFHADFSLSASGESVYLTDSFFNVLDFIEYGAQSKDISYGRYPNGVGAFQTMNPTFGAENSNDPIVSGLFDKEINAIAIHIFPNPAKGSFNLEIEDATTETKFVKVFNLQGKLVYEDKIEQDLTINTGNWTTGLYLVTINGQTEKVLIK